jgi:hypothetical protein
MAQNRSSGAAGNAFGHETAPKIAAAMNATMLGTESNRALWDRKQVVIKCAGKNTSSVGVIYDMLDEIELVLGAFQHKDGSFDVYTLSSELYRKHARDSRSAGADGRIGVVSKQVFVKHGKRVKLVKKSQMATPDA